MKTKNFILALMLSAGLFSVKAQTSIATSTLNSWGYQVGVSGIGATYFGYQAGTAASGSSIGNYNTCFGSNAGSNQLGSTKNTFLGYNAGNFNNGYDNVYLGFNAGSRSATDASNGTQNVVIGNNAGHYGGSSQYAFQSNNTIIGFNAGKYIMGSGGNILIGSNTGPTSPSSLVSNQLFIDNVGGTTPLIWGNFATASRQVKLNGKVGIGAVGTFPIAAGGADVSAYKLFVTGGILTYEVRVALNTTWADYVFAKNYNLIPLTEVENYITTNGHLPNMPSGTQVKADGINVAEMARIQQEKIEELTLYIIDQNKRIEALEAKINGK